MNINGQCKRIILQTPTFFKRSILFFANSHVRYPNFAVQWAFTAVYLFSLFVTDNPSVWKVAKKKYTHRKKNREHLKNMPGTVVLIYPD